jgi:hypothetical protein
MGVAEDQALYIRKRLLRLHEMNRTIIPKRQWMAMEKCILWQLAGAANPWMGGEAREIEAL